MQYGTIYDQPERNWRDRSEKLGQETEWTGVFKFIYSTSIGHSQESAN